jgi:hypothetical protein
MSQAGPQILLAFGSVLAEVIAIGLILYLTLRRVHQPLLRSHYVQLAVLILAFGVCVASAVAGGRSITQSITIADTYARFGLVGMLTVSLAAITLITVGCVAFRRRVHRGLPKGTPPI